MEEGGGWGPGEAALSSEDSGLAGPVLFLPRRLDRHTPHPWFLRVLETFVIFWNEPTVSLVGRGESPFSLSSCLPLPALWDPCPPGVCTRAAGGGGGLAGLRLCLPGGCGVCRADAAEASGVRFMALRCSPDTPPPPPHTAPGRLPTGLLTFSHCRSGFAYLKTSLWSQKFF